MAYRSASHIQPNGVAHVRGPKVTFHRFSLRFLPLMSFVNVNISQRSSFYILVRLQTNLTGLKSRGPTFLAAAV